MARCAADTRVLRVLYRSLLKVAKSFDAKPARKVYFTSEPAFRDAIGAYLKPGFLKAYCPPVVDFSSCVRIAFATEKELGPSLDTGIEALLKLNQSLAIANKNLVNETGPPHLETDIRCVPTTSLEPGVILVAHPLLNTLSDEGTRSRFKRTCVLICESDHTGWQGLILNSPLETNLKQLLPLGLIQQHAELLRPFFEQSVWSGGPEEVSSEGSAVVQCLHTVPNVAGARHLGEGLYWGGALADLAQQVQDSALLGEAGIESKGVTTNEMLAGNDAEHVPDLKHRWREDLSTSGQEILEPVGSQTVASEHVAMGGTVGTEAPRMRLYYGATQWGPGQLDREVKMGAWFPVEVTGLPRLALGDQRTSSLWAAVVSALPPPLSVMATVPPQVIID